MAILFVVFLAGAALYAAMTLSSLQPFGTAMAGGAVVVFAAAMIATLPAGQTLSLSAPLSSEAATPAKAVLAWVAAFAAAGGGGLGWALRAAFHPRMAQTPDAATAPPDPATAVEHAKARARVLRDAGMLTLCLVLALAGAVFQQISVPRALLIGLCAGIALIAAIDLREALPREPPLMRSNWGGLGGGLGGWELSRSAVLLGVVLAFAGAALAAAVVAVVPSPPAPQPGHGNAVGAPTPTPSKASDKPPAKPLDNPPAHPPARP